MGVTKIANSVYCKLRLKLKTVGLRNKVKIGRGVVFRKKIFLNPSSESALITIGDECFFNNYCSINCHCRVSIGCGCSFGEGVKIYDHDHNFRKIVNHDTGAVPLYIDKPVSIGDNCWLGSNVIVLKGVRIGNNVVVGAGVIVTKDIPDNTVVYARQDFVCRPI